MKKTIVGLSISTLFLCNIWAQDISAQRGQVIFETKGCVTCHKDDIDTIGPSLSTIAREYLGKERELLSYLRGQAPAIIDPARAPVMDPQLVKIRSLFDPDMQALTMYIISANDRPF
ncbi:c-type cytochrome [Sulfurimonas sp.]|jgi:cytochrome c|uniref:c-type cytochrome n=1 Tax=Sulfurimonas sp. TaxID=2022749 RepID=UPI0025EFEA46|nr:c-type cytochrome [Sulfurimonas sp.]MCK9472113.1 c-type cytochrome [Sulfurimonas sp.]